MPLKSFRDRVDRFARVYLWLAREYVFSKKVRFIVIVALMAGGAIAQGGTIAFVAFAVNQLQNPQKLGVNFLDRMLSNTIMMLVMFGTCLLMISLLGACATYAASIKSRAMARSCHERCAVLALRTMNDSSSLNRAGLPESESDLRRLVVRNTNHMGKAVESLISLAAPAWRMLVAAIILFSIDFKLSLMSAPLFLFLLPMVYKLSSGVQKNAKSFYEDSVLGLSRRVGAIVRLISGQNALAGPRWTKHFTELYEKDKEVLTYFEEYDKLQLAQDRVQFATSAATSALIVFAMMVGGYMAVVSDKSWGMVVAYLLALVQMVNAMKNALAHLTNLSVFYPATSQYRQFIFAAEKNIEPYADDDKSFKEACKSIHIRSVYDKISGIDTVDFDLSPGIPVYYLTPQFEMDRLTVAKVVEPLIESTTIHRGFWADHTFFISLRSGSRTGSLRMHLGGGGEDENADEKVEELIHALNLQPKIDSLPKGLDTDITEEIWADLHPDLRMTIIIGPIIPDHRRIVLFDLRLFRHMECDTARAVLELLRDRYVLLVTSMLHPPRWLAEVVIQIEDGRVQRIGDISEFASTEESSGTAEDDRTTDLDDTEQEATVLE